MELPADVRALFEAPNYAHLATVLPSGGPHTVPALVAAIIIAPLLAAWRRRASARSTSDGEPVRQGDHGSVDL